MGEIPQSGQADRRPGRGQAALVVAIIMVAIVGLHYLPLEQAVFWWTGNPRPDPTSMVTLYGAVKLLVGVGIAWWLCRGRGSSPREMGLARGPVDMQIIRAVWVAFCLAALPCWWLTLEYALPWIMRHRVGGHFQPDNGPNAESMSAAFDALGGLGPVALMCAVGAMAEELFFRGLLLRYVAYATRDPWVAILVSSLVFSSIHLRTGPNTALGAMWAGLVLGTFYLRYRSLLTVTVAHFLFNFALAVIPRMIASPKAG